MTSTSTVPPTPSQKWLCSTAAGLTLMLTAAGTASAWDAILTCRFEEETGFTIEKGRVAHHRDPFGPNEVVFAGLDSSAPTMKGGLGESRLVVVRRESERCG